MTEAVGGRKGPFNGAVAPTVASVGDGLGDVTVERIADCHVEDVAGGDPDDHEEAEHDIADSGVA